jgi:hypothetical protein
MAQPRMEREHEHYSSFIMHLVARGGWILGTWIVGEVERCEAAWRLPMNEAKARYEVWKKK